MPTVLVADDSPVSLLAVTRRLRAEGYDVHEHASAASAKGETATALSCALLDLDLGDGEGTDVALALHANFPGLPVAFFSASVAGDVLTRAGAIGPVFAKPGELDQAIQWVCAQAERGSGTR